MPQTTLSKSMLSRLPLYLQSVEMTRTESISATRIAKELHLGEVLVRKDLASISRQGRPRSGYPTQALRQDIIAALGKDHLTEAVIVGAGRLGRALLEYDGFKVFGLDVSTAFDINATDSDLTQPYANILPIRRLKWYCVNHDVRIGILAVPESAAQEACDLMVQSGIKAILSFPQCALEVPEHVTVQQENVALSLAHLKMLSQSEFRK